MFPEYALAPRCHGPPCSVRCPAFAYTPRSIWRGFFVRR